MTGSEEMLLVLSLSSLLCREKRKDTVVRRGSEHLLTIVEYITVNIYMGEFPRVRVSMTRRVKGVHSLFSVPSPSEPSSSLVFLGQEEDTNCLAHQQPINPSEHLSPLDDTTTQPNFVPWVPCC
eukprot:scaffold2100_cov207-Amphora_coffeaeformis.AAC.2